MGRLCRTMDLFFALLAMSMSGPASAAHGLASLAPVDPVSACASLTSADIGHDIGAAVRVTRSADETREGARYCKIEAVVAEHIRFELLLPSAGWSQRYVQLGCGGLCGVLSIRLEHAENCQPARDHTLALASTDMGHEGKFMGDGTFGNNPQARIDFAYRGVHLTALASKALIAKFYGKEARYSYFSGCSDGGREALMEAERFPGDFDGIAAGAPAMNFQVQNTFYHAWMYLSNHRADGTAILTAAKLPALHAAALKSCDAVDGQTDGIIVDPRACHFDPADAQCKTGQSRGDSCLTAEEVAVARKLYEGPRDSAGHRFTIGGPQVGSELAWRGVYVPGAALEPVMSQDAALGTLRHLAFEQNPGEDYSLKDFRFDEATFARLKTLHPLYDATDTDLSRFVARHGKLILWHGWSDPHISPLNTIAYYHAARALLGERRADDALRLFLFPGMYHCAGGDGFSAFDVLTPLMTWVEGAAAPDVLIAAQSSARLPLGPPGPGGPPGPPPGNLSGPPMLPPPANAEKLKAPSRFRPVYAYPKVPKYSGAGSVNDASSYLGAPPLIADPSKYDWEGAGFLSPDFHRDCSAQDGRLSCS